MFRRDEQLSSGALFHKRPSLGCSDSFLQVMSPGKFRPKSEIAKFHLSHLAFLFNPKMGAKMCPLFSDRACVPGNNLCRACIRKIRKLIGHISAKGDMCISVIWCV